MVHVKESLVTRMPTVTEHSPRDVDNACAKLVGKEMEEAARVTKAFFLLERIFSPSSVFLPDLCPPLNFPKHLSQNTSLCVFFHSQDFNECQSSENNCHQKAECMNTAGSFECRCKPGYRGSGVNCTR